MLSNEAYEVDKELLVDVGVIAEEVFGMANGFAPCMTVSPVVLASEVSVETPVSRAVLLLIIDPSVAVLVTAGLADVDSEPTDVVEAGLRLES